MGRKIFVYAGNMGVAQGLDVVIELAERLKIRRDIGFLFVGRGGEADRLAQLVQKRALNNVLVFDEIDPDEIPDLYAQCHVGIVALDARHKSHNIPGKFLTYMQCGLPVLANVNSGNDLAELIRQGDVGQVCESNDIAVLEKMVCILLDQLSVDIEISQRCKDLFERQFSVQRAVKQIVSSIKNTNTSMSV
jgi:glycosyltransferase involved in cell wall biosynthesis